MNKSISDFQNLNHALRLAEIRRGFCSPNPSVGALIVDPEGEVIAEGFHETCGSAHAEIIALRNLKKSPKGGTLYVTLEPCCHWGKTPPCTDAIIQSGIKRVVFGFKDPNPLVNGDGMSALKKAGITCEYLPTPEINSFYESYHYWIVNQKPFITIKLAMSLDGKIAGPSGERVQISGEVEQEFVHLSRKSTDAILTTVKTVIYDDPKLNARLLTETIKKPIYILDKELNLPPNATIFSTAESITLFHARDASLLKKEQLQNRGVRCYSVDVQSDGLDLQQIIAIIGKEGVHDLWVEAGGRCFASFIQKKLVQKSLISVAPLWIGRGQTAFSDTFSFNSLSADQITWKQLGKDGLCEIRWIT